MNAEGYLPEGVASKDGQVLMMTIASLEERLIESESVALPPKTISPEGESRGYIQPPGSINAREISMYGELTDTPNTVFNRLKTNIALMGASEKVAVVSALSMLGSTLGAMALPFWRHMVLFNDRVIRNELIKDNLNEIVYLSVLTSALLLAASVRQMCKGKVELQEMYEKLVVLGFPINSQLAKKIRYYLS